MKIVSFSLARSKLTEIVNNAFYTGQRTLLTKNNKQVGAFVSMEDLHLLEQMEDHADLEAIQKIRTESPNDFISWDEAKAELSL